MFVCVLCVAAMRRGKFWRQWGAGAKVLPCVLCCRWYFAADQVRDTAYQGYLPLIPAYDRLWMSTKIFVPFDCEYNVCCMFAVWIKN